MTNVHSDSHDDPLATPAALADSVETKGWRNLTVAEQLGHRPQCDEVGGRLSSLVASG